ncbi:MAG: SDR family oxidoreductase [Planctomycetes bacterium]|nr:SDR family oxidoreductase [Planctomycetota bacterium]
MARKRVVVVTGVSRGLGRALADELIERGHRVYGCCRSSQAVQELRERHGSPHDFRIVDVSADDEVRQWAEGLLQTGPAPDLVLNNAALINRNAPLWEVPPDEFSRLIDVNIKGVYYVARHFLPALIRQGRGVLVNFSSGWGRSTSAEVAPYCASKWAVEGLTQALAEELPDGVAAVPLNPGIIHTEMLKSCFGADASSYPSAQEWARRAVPFLLSLSRQHNGQPLTVPFGT